jgi:tyrosyl-tRNA synthetase
MSTVTEIGMGDINDQLELIQRGTVEVINLNELKTLLSSKKKLVIKAGFDPTAADLHLGHTVLLHKLRQFQQLGHEVCFLIGDFTAAIGDPTGKNVTRKPLSKEEIAAYASTYQEQVFKILDRQKTRVVFNSSWLTPLGAQGLIELAAKYTLARLLERDDFSKRYRSNTPIAVHELLYPLLQGYDSVALRADVELGGSDQTFNLLVGRELQSRYGQTPQVVITLPLLEGLDGVQKMSKSLNNYIGINEAPEDIFGKVMSISDVLMWRYFELLSAVSNASLAQYQADVVAGRRNPRDLKLLLAQELTERFCGAEAAEAAKTTFIARFSHKHKPAQIATLFVALPPGETGLPLLKALKQVELIPSIAEGRRLLQQRGIRLDEQQLSATEAEPYLLLERQYLVQVGKHAFAYLQLGHACA